ncbi:MAG: YbaB/EbfC family nucleoid-associated protein [Gemmataceae bacterium]|nr:YbaB/EbfC family nucleoid-associated protein [Gemmataceae bacterium]MCS7269683.1 YbaB/EbfC family nucleoid-associated protein [Gemmataceae bacterium]MDW8242271.1 YbaB/EbfC family nucleoid-associated protein [Thermogemmata sp.]
MFKEIGQLMQLLRNQGKLQEELEKFRQQLGSIVVEATAGGGYVTAKVNGRLELVDLRLSDDLLDLHDREMMEDLIVAAVNQALTLARQRIAEEGAKMATQMGLANLWQNMPGLTPGS